MTDQHLSETEIQNYALSKSHSEEHIAAHLHTCDHCREQVKSYQLLFTGIRSQPAPDFDFDLSATVLAEIAQPQKKFAWDIFFVYLLSLAGIAFILAGLFKFRQYFIQMSSGPASMFLYLLLTPILAIVIFQCVDFYKKYQKKMNALNFY